VEARGLVIQRLEYFSYKEKVRGSNPFESITQPRLSRGWKNALQKKIYKKMKKVYYTLLKSKGIGPTLALKICISLGVSTRTTYNSLSPEKLEGLAQVMGYLRKISVPSPLPRATPLVPCAVGGPQQNLGGTSIIMSPIDSLLYQFNKKNILKLIELNTFRGRRHKLGYPVRGQRTRSNAKTAKRLNRAYLS
jgi:small subunit ribosomal protein S13